MKKGLIIIILIVLTLGVIGGNVSNELANILLGACISLLGIVSIVICYILKRTFIVNKAYLLNVVGLVNVMGPTPFIATIKYDFRGEEYTTEIGVYKKSPFADRSNIGGEYDIYMSEKFPKIVVDKIPNNFIVYTIGIVLFFTGLMIIFANIY